MTASRKLGRERGIPESTLLVIDKVHEVIDSLMRLWAYEPFTEERSHMFTQLDFLLQKLWEFPSDSSRHTYPDSYKFATMWAGRKFRCTETGEEYTIPYTVKQGDYIQIGMCYLDVGNMYYNRVVGYGLVEITEEQDEESESTK